VVTKDADNLTEKRSLALAGKTMGPAHGVFLGNTGDAEGLAGKAPKQYVMVRNIRVLDQKEVLKLELAPAEISLVVQPCELVPFVGEDASDAGMVFIHLGKTPGSLFKTQSESPRTGKQVNNSIGVHRKSLAVG